MKQTKGSLSSLAGRQQHIHGLAEAARQIAREHAQTEELSNYFEVLTFFKNPPYGSEQVILDPKKGQ